MGHNDRPQRQACDRCHCHKLKCDRTPRQGGACQRCIRAGRQCIYSPPRPLGRPATRRSQSQAAETPTAHTSNQTSPVQAQNMIEEPLLDNPLSMIQDDWTSGSSTTLEGSTLGQQTMMDTGLLTPEATETHIPGAAAPSCGPLSERSAITTPTMSAAFWPFSTETNFLHVENNILSDQDHLTIPRSLESVGLTTWQMGLTPLFEEPNPFCAAQTRLMPSPEEQYTVTIEYVERRLSHLQLHLYETLQAFSADGGRCFDSAVCDTIKATQVFLDIITTLTAQTLENPGLNFESQSFVTIQVLVATCYTRILHNMNILTARIQQVISSGDTEAMRMLPNIQIGSFTSSSSMASTLQPALLVQLLTQLLREMGRRLRAMSAPTTSHEQQHQGRGERRGSNITNVLDDADSKIAHLENSIRTMLENILETMEEPNGL